MRVLTCTSLFLRFSTFVMAPTSSRKNRSEFLTRTSLFTCKTRHALMHKSMLSLPCDHFTPGEKLLCNSLSEASSYMMQAVEVAVMDCGSIALSDDPCLEQCSAGPSESQAAHEQNLWLLAYQLCLFQLLCEVDQIALHLSSARLPVGQMRPSHPAGITQQLCCCKLSKQDCGSLCLSHVNVYHKS